MQALRAFDAAARTGSLTRAAETLHVTHGAISHQIKALEETFGVKLVDGAGRGIRLTDEGERFAVRLRGAARRKILGAVREITERSNPRQLRLSTLPSFAARWLLPASRGSSRRIPTSTSRSAPATGSSTFAARTSTSRYAMAPGNGPGHRGTPARRNVLPGLQPAAGERQAAEARRPTFAHFTLLRGDGEQWKPWFEAAGLDWPEPARGPLYSDSSHMLQAAIEGQGIAIARSSLLGDDLKNGVLVQLFDVVVPLPRKYYLVYPPRMKDSPKLDAFRAWLKQELGTHPDAGDPPVAVNGVRPRSGVVFQLVVKELQHEDLVAAQRGLRAAPVAACAPIAHGAAARCAHEIGVQQRRMDVVLAAHRARVAQALGDGVDARAGCCGRPRAGSRPAPCARSATAASMVPPQVRKSFAVTSRPVISRRYAFTSSEETRLALARASRYWNSSWPGRSWQRWMMRARRGSVSDDVVLDAALAAEAEAQRSWPSTCTWRRRSVVRPNELFSRAYSSLPTRISVRSSRRTTVARSWRRRGRGARRSRSMRSRRRGSTSLNSSMRRNFESVARLAIAPGDSGTACGRARRAPVAWMWPSGSGQIQTSVQAGGMASVLSRWRLSRIA